MRIVLLGPPGSGRRVLAKKLAGHLELTYLNLNDLLGEMAKEDTDFGRLIGELLAACAPVPEELVASALNTVLDDAAARKGFILDDYPRELAHAESLDNLLNNKGMPIDVVIALDVDSDELMERLVGKLTCDGCGTQYNLYTNPPLVDGVCDLCGGRVARRPGDYEQNISNRLRVYEANASQILARYEPQGILSRLRGTGDQARIFSACVRIIQNAPRRELIQPQVEAESRRGKRGRMRKKTAVKKKVVARPSAERISTRDTVVTAKTAAVKTKAAPKKAAPKKAAPKKAAPKKAAPKKAAPKKAAPRKAAPRKAASKKASVRSH